MQNQNKYQEGIKARSKVRFTVGMLARVKRSLIFAYNRWLARKKGALIGENTNIPYLLAKKANSNLIIGNNVSVQTDKIDTRIKIVIGNNVIIGNNVEIITVSHNIHSPEWEHKYYGIIIEDYVWLASNALILPSCRYIGYGAVIAAGSVVAKDVQKMSVVAGNPTIEINKRKEVHKDLVVESLLGGDLMTYIRTRKA